MFPLLEESPLRRGARQSPSQVTPRTSTGQGGRDDTYMRVWEGKEVRDESIEPLVPKAESRACSVVTQWVLSFARLLYGSERGHLHEGVAVAVPAARAGGGTRMYWTLELGRAATRGSRRGVRAIVSGTLDPYGQRTSSWGLGQPGPLAVVGRAGSGRDARGEEISPGLVRSPTPAVRENLGVTRLYPYKFRHRASEPGPGTRGGAHWVSR